MALANRFSIYTLQLVRLLVGKLVAICCGTLKGKACVGLS